VDFLLLLLGITCVAVFSAAGSIVTGWGRPRARLAAPQALLQTHWGGRGNIPYKHTRELPSISIRECETLIRSADGVLFISVNETGVCGPLPFHDMYPLVMTPRQFAHEVRWFPSNTCVVLWGDVQLCSSAFEMLENIPAIPPIFVLRDRSRRWEVA
jgi:hypothetical protein